MAARHQKKDIPIRGRWLQESNEKEDNRERLMIK